MHIKAEKYKMTVKTIQTEAVQELLKKVAGLDNNQGSPRVKEIMYRLMSDIYNN